MSWMPGQSAVARAVIVAVGVAAAILPVAVLAAAVDLPVSGGSERLVYLQQGNPAAALILFSGGDGVLKISPDGNFGVGNNFLVRTRDLWVQQGFAAAIPDVPTGRSDLYNFRTTAAYSDDVAEIVAYVRTQTQAPIWLVGTSQGTNAAAGAAGRLSHGEIAGVVLTSSLTREGGKPEFKETVFKADLAAINIPVLIVSHSDDQCAVTPPGDAERIKAALKSSPKTEIVLVSGGLPPKSSACEARSQHGYFGIEQEVVTRIAAWIKSNSK